MGEANIIDNKVHKTTRVFMSVMKLLIIRTYADQTFGSSNSTAIYIFKLILLSDKP